MDKKKVMNMVHEEKNRKTELPRLGINIDFGLRLAAILAVVGVFRACGATFSTILGAYIIYRVARLILRLIGQILAITFSFVHILIILIIFYLIII